jgi:hypothetical protein
MQKTTWKKIDAALRTELDAIVKTRANTWHPDYLDAVAWWLLLMLACVGGVGTWIWYQMTEPDGLAGLFALAREQPLWWLRSMLLSPHNLGVLAALVIGPWTAVTWARNHNRRGLALTRDAIVIVRGNRLRILRYEEVAGAERRTIRTRNRPSFTVLTLQLKNGKKKDLYATGNWAELAIARLPATPAP